MRTVHKATGKPVKETLGHSISRKVNVKSANPESGTKKVTLVKNSENRTSWIKSQKTTSLEGKYNSITDGLSNLVRSAMKGVDTKVFYSFASAIDIPDKYLAEIINTSVKTLSNYKESNKALDPVKGEHLLRIIALFKKGEDIFGNLHEFQGWLTKPQFGSNEVPIDWLVTPGGVDLVSQELDRIAYGYAL